MYEKMLKNSCLILFQNIINSILLTVLALLGHKCPVQTVDFSSATMMLQGMHQWVIRINSAPVLFITPQTKTPFSAKGQVVNILYCIIYYHNCDHLSYYIYLLFEVFF